MPEIIREGLPEISIPDIDRCVQTCIFDELFSSAAVIASVGGRVFHRQIYGRPTFNTSQRKLGFDALFDLASLTKPLGSGLGALWLASRNRIDLNARLPRTIDVFRYQEKFEGVSVDMLLDHTSGFPAYRSFWKDVQEHDKNPKTKEKLFGTAKAAALVQELIADTPLESGAGMKTVYSDLNFMVLGWILESIAGRPLDDFLMREVYRPLGIHEDLFFVRVDDKQAKSRMRRRVFVATEDCSERNEVVAGDVHDLNAYALGGVAGHAGLFGTGDAVWKLVHALWAAQKGTDTFFPGGTVRRFWRKSRRLRDTTRTLAWDTPDLNDSVVGKRFTKNSVGHLGYTGCSVWLDLSTDVIAVVLTNAVHPTKQDKDEPLKMFRKRIHELIAKEGEALPPDASRPQGSEAFYGPGAGTTVPLNNPLKGPSKF